MNLHELLFWSLAIVTCGCAIAVAVTQNIVRAAVWLLFSLAATAGLFFLLGADFVGAIQLMVYVGGVLILIIFGVMLTASGPFVDMKTGAGEWSISIVVGLLLYALLGGTVVMGPWEQSQPKIHDTKVARSSNDIGLSLLGVEKATPEAKLTAEPDKDRKQMSYLLPFEIVSLHLLVVLIGAAYLARAKRRKEAAQA